MDYLLLRIRLLRAMEELAPFLKYPQSPTRWHRTSKFLRYRPRPWSAEGGGQGVHLQPLMLISSVHGNVIERAGTYQHKGTTEIQS